jgi:hypothetical protein
MKRMMTLGLLTVAVVGVATQLLPLREGRSLSAPTRLVASPSPAANPNAFYLSDRFGFQITLPKGYIIAPSESAPPTQPARPLEVLELWNQADYPHRASLPETPPLITITVYNNTRRLPLSAYKGELSHNDDRLITVGGQPAIAYTSTGLYESDNVLLSSADGRYVFRLRGSYMDANAPIRQDFQNVVSSLTLDVLLPPTPSTSKRDSEHSID